jgi:hypothetical protein
MIASGLDPMSGQQAIYVTYWKSSNLIVAGSNEGFQNLQNVVYQTVSDEGHGDVFGQPAVSRDGALDVSWHKHVESPDPMINDSGTLYFDRDQDGLWGSGTFGTDRTVRTFAPGESLRFEQVDAQPQRGIHTGPVLAVDASGGAHNGRLYIAFVQWKDAANDDSDVLLAYSENPYTTWNFVTVETPTSTEFLPWVDVDQATGSVNVLYYTTQGDPTNNDDVKMRLATRFNVADPLELWTIANITTATSNELDPLGYGGDYLEYSGLDVHQGTAHGLFGFDPASNPSSTELDAMHVDAAFVNASNALTINGDDAGSTNDTIVVQRVSSNSNYLEVLVNGVRQFAGRYDTVAKLVINGLSGNDTITIDDSVSLPSTINGGVGDDTIHVLGGSSTSEALVDGATGINVLNVNTDNTGFARARLATQQTLSALNIGSGGVLDIANNVVIIDYMGTSPLTTIQSLITTGYASGAWTGNGIRSSTAAAIAANPNDPHKTGIGFAEATDLFSSFPATFAGQTVDDTTVLVKYTFYGDADLTGNVNLQDFNRLAANFGQSPRRWAHGDFNYDTLVNLVDFDLLASNFGHMGLGPGGGGGTYGYTVWDLRNHLLHGGHGLPPR